MTEAALAQRRKNSLDIAARKRAKTKCKYGHNHWGINRTTNRRYCIPCSRDRAYYNKQGIERPDA